MGRLIQINLAKNIPPKQTRSKDISLIWTSKDANKLRSPMRRASLTQISEATDWVHPIANLLKPNGSLRFCLDPAQPNKNLKCEPYALSKLTEIFARLSNSLVFSALDAT